MKVPAAARHGPAIVDRSRPGEGVQGPSRWRKMERAMRFELTTSTLARLRSTPELRPRLWGRGQGMAPAQQRADNTHCRGVCKTLLRLALTCCGGPAVAL